MIFFQRHTFLVGNGRFQNSFRQLLIFKNTPGRTWLFFFKYERGACHLFKSFTNTYLFFEGGQTKEHARLARAFGMKRVLMVVNKMDACDWSQERYEHIVYVMKKFLKKQLGFSSKSIQAVPISGVLGVNLVEPLSEEICAWYDGPSLIGCLDALKIKHSK